MTDVFCGDSAVESGRRVPPTVAAGTNGTRTEAVHAWNSHARRPGVRLIKGTPSATARGNGSSLTIKSQVGGVIRISKKNGQIWSCDSGFRIISLTR